MNNITKKIVASITVLTCSVWMMGPGVASALTAEELQEQIDTLLATLSTLQSQLTTLEGTTEEAEEAVTIEGVPADFTFEDPLKLTSTGDDVKYLQIVLNSDSDTQLAESGVGSPGEETSYFGPLTKAAVIKFQELYTEDVLATYGLTTGTGYVGTTTMAKLNSLLAAAEEEEEAVCSGITDAVECVTANCSWDATTETCSGVAEEEEEEEVVCSGITDAVECVTAGCSWDATAETCSGVAEEEDVTGELNAALAADTPVAQLVPTGVGAGGAPASNVAFTKVTFTGSGEVSKIVVTRGGVSTDASLTGVKLYDGDTQIGITQTFNALHQAVFNLTTPWEVSGTKTLTIAGDYTAGNVGQVVLSIQSDTDITADVAVGGTFPIVGNSATGSAVDVGSLTVDNGSLQPVAGGAVDVDATNFIFMQMKLTAGAAEDVYVNAVTIARGIVASFIDSDLTNITLYNDTAGTEIGKVTALGTNSKTTFSLATPLLIERGRFVEMSVRADILSGSTRNVAFDVNDGVAYTVLAAGESYGYGVALAAGNFLGIGPATQINRGLVNVSKGASCPATGNVAVGGSDVELGSFNLKARGEDVRIGRMIVSLERITVTALRTAVTDLSLVKLVDSAGTVFAGPVTPTLVAATDDAIATFTTSLTLSPGNNELFVVANLANNVLLANCQYRVGFDAAIGGTPGGGVAITNVRGMTSNLPLVAGTQLTPAANVRGNVMTARQGALTADMTATPVAGNVIIGGQSVTIANLKLDATASGEDVRITQIILTKAGTEAWAFGTLSDIELWDGTTQVGLTMQPTTGVATVAFTLTTPYVVSSGVSKALAVKANLIGGTAGLNHTWTVAAPTCATTTGAPVGVNAPGTASLAQTLQAQGDLRVVIDASPVASAQLVADTTDNEVVRYKFWAYDEDVDVTQVWVWAGDNTSLGAMPASAPADIASVSLWLGSTKISGDVPVAAGVASLIGVPAGTLVVPKNGSKVVTLKISFNEKVSLTSGTNYQFGIADDGTTDSGGGYANDAVVNDDSWGQVADVDNGYNILATGSDSGLPIPDIDDTLAATAGQVFGSNAMEVFDGKLVISLSSASPSGTQSAGANQEILRLSLEAVGDDINVDGLRLIASATQLFDSAAADTATLESVDGTVIYATTQAAVTDTFDTGNSVCFGNNALLNALAGAGAGCGVGGAAFTNALVISEGTTISVSVRGDTTPGVTVTNTTLQLSLIDGTSAGGAADVDITWNDVSLGTPNLVATKVIPLYGNTIRY